MSKGYSIRFTLINSRVKAHFPASSLNQAHNLQPPRIQTANEQHAIPTSKKGDKSACQALHNLSFKQKITKAYAKIESIPGEEQSFTFDISLTTRSIQPTPLFKMQGFYNQADHNFSHMFCHPLALL